MPGPKLVLIVEDDRIIRVLSAELLLEDGMAIVEAADGEEAIEILERRASEIGGLVTDVKMPGARNGVDLAKDVTVRWPWISILVTSGNYSQRPPDLPLQVQFLPKPWPPEAVLDFARRAVCGDLN